MITKYILCFCLLTMTSGNNVVNVKLCVNCDSKPYTGCKAGQNLLNYYLKTPTTTQDTVDICNGVTCENGGTCVGGKCNCANGFTGTRCEMLVNVCDSMPCMNGGTCQSSGQAWQCFCSTGFKNSIDCSVYTQTSGNEVVNVKLCVNCDSKPYTDLVSDPCGGITCSNGGTCVSGTCVCVDGFTGTRCENAVLDLCDGVACVNGGICSGGICACPLGYYGLLCEIKGDPCNPNPCMNGGTCQSVGPLILCQCPIGILTHRCT